MADLSRSVPDFPAWLWGIQRLPLTFRPGSVAADSNSINASTMGGNANGVANGIANGVAQAAPPARPKMFKADKTMSNKTAFDRNFPPVLPQKEIEKNSRGMFF